jgi:hypothetical protein
MAALALLDGEAEALTRTAVEMALAGDVTALRLCLDRICPPSRERPLSVDLPPLDKPNGLATVTATITMAVADGRLLPGEGEILAKLVEGHRRAIETGDLARRIEALEKQNDYRKAP